MKNSARFLKAAELRQIVVRENEEPLICLDDQEGGILCRPRRKDGKILVRQLIALNLQKAQKRLQQKHPNRQLMVVEGYRHPFVQEREFLHYFSMLARQYPTMNVADLEEKAHQWVALPSVAGHPTGGAVDVTFADQGQEADMGCAIADFSQPALLATAAPGLTSAQCKDRLLLHDLMVEAGFAPFYGEWWHFSLGDREWAAFYAQPQTLYGSIDLKDHG